jgi:hypothetical protein
MPPPTKKEILEARRILLLADQDGKAVKKNPKNLRKTTKKTARLARRPGQRRRGVQ